MEQVAQPTKRYLSLCLMVAKKEERMKQSHLFQFIMISALVFTLAACSGSESLPTTPSTPSKGNEPPLGTAMFGAYIKGAVWNKEILFDLETSLEHEFKILHWFTNWDTPFEGTLVERILELERIPLITWQATNKPLPDISAGRYDSYLRTWAKGVGDVQGEVYIRLFPEMNGNWTSWNGNPEQLVAAWQHIVTLFRQEGATNARWVWSPNAKDEPATANNRMENYYPGEGYVDVLALDGYNWGTTRTYTAWKTFEDIFETPYARVTALGKQPVWLAEIASTEHGGDKATWINEMLNSTAFPRINAVVWFNENKETDWRIESSQQSLLAFRDWFDDTPTPSALLASR
jgi:Glycosyl hydrolase family 26